MSAAEQMRTMAIPRLGAPPLTVELPADLDGASEGTRLGAAVRALYDAGRRDFTGANLRGADLRGAILRGAILRGAILRGAILRDAILRGADLRDANLFGANLTGADLTGANLAGANLAGADLRGADMECAILRGADLRGAILRDAILRGADLRGADLRAANLTGADLTGATGAIPLPVADPRSYRWVAVAHADGWRVVAGCRQFTVAEARAHWLRPDYTGPRSVAETVGPALDWLERQPLPPPAEDKEHDA